MKRISLILSLLFLLLSVGCAAPQQNGALPAETAAGQTYAEPRETLPAVTEAPADEAFYLLEGGFEYAVNGGREHVMETEDSYYCVLQDSSDRQKSVLWFSDKEYREWMPLCSRPDCRHRDDNCNAHLEVGCMAVWLYGDHIYYAGGSEIGKLPQVWRMKLDGTDHELVFDNSPQILPEDITGCTWAGSSHWYHENLIFMSVSYEVSYSPTEEGSSAAGAGWVRRLFYVDLADPDEAHELVFTDENGEISDIPFGLTAAAGDRIWCTTAPVGYNEDGSRTMHNSEVYVFDLAAETCLKLCDLPIFVDMNMGWMSDGKLWYVGCSADEQDVFTVPEDGLPYYEPFGDQHLHIVCVDTVTGEVGIAATRLRDEVSWSFVFSGYVMSCENSYSDPKLAHGTYLYGTDGELISFIPYEKYGEDITMYYVVGDMVFGYKGTNDLSDSRTMQYPSAHPPVYYLDLGLIGTEDFNWKKWEP